MRWFASLLALGVVLTSFVALWLVPAAQVVADAAAIPPTSSVTPSLLVHAASGLTNGQAVQVSGTGFAPAAQVAVRQCPAGATSGDACRPDAATVAPTDLDGSFSTSVVVSRELSIGG